MISKRTKFAFLKLIFILPFQKSCPIKVFPNYVAFITKRNDQTTNQANDI